MTNPTGADEEGEVTRSIVELFLPIITGQARQFWKSLTDNERAHVCIYVSNRPKSAARSGATTHGWHLRNA
jgi:hypothetical protein